MRHSHTISLIESKSRFIPMLATVALLSACGGSGDSGTFLSDEGTGITGSIVDGGDPVSTIVVMGGQIDSTFVEGQVALGLTEISAGGITSASIELRDGDGNSVLTSYEVTFSSVCAEAGLSTIEPTVISTTNGQAEVDYTAQGCEGNDEITATATVEGEALTALSTLLVETDAVGSVEFAFAAPNQIALAGSGGTENSVVSFVVRGETGSPLQNATVNFGLNTETGGLTLFPDNDVSGADGVVSTTVSAGTIATTIRVTATEQSSGISTQSSELVVSTGIPDQDSFSISITDFNAEAGDFDGETTEVTIRAADAFNNPAPVGTAISFYTEGGSIDPTCSIGEDGGCTVTWRSQAPKPANGRVTILATAIGNESFTDSNGNGLFDDIDVEFNTIDDLGEAYADINENGRYDIGEFFIDFGVPNGLRDGPDGAYNGVLCADPSAVRCSSDNSVVLYEQTVIILSKSDANFDSLFTPGGALVPQNSTLHIPDNSVSSFVLRTADIDGNAMPVGTTVNVTSDPTFELSGSSSLTIISTTKVNELRFSLKQTEAGLFTGTLTATFTTPNGVVTIQTWLLD